MKRILIVAATLAIALLVGCSGGASSQQASQPSSQGESVTQADRDAAAAYIGSKEFGDLSAYVTTVMDGVVDLADSGNASEIQSRFQTLSGMIQAMDTVTAPESCKDVDYALKQLARAEAVALGDFSEAAMAKATGDLETAAKAMDEASEYTDKANQFTKEYNDATNALMAQFS